MTSLRWSLLAWSAWRSAAWWPGYIGDRFGRHIALFVSIFLFGAATCAIGLAQRVARTWLVALQGGLT